MEQQGEPESKTKKSSFPLVVRRSSASPSLEGFQKAASRGEKEEYFDQNWQTQGQEEEKREKPEKTEYAIQKRL